MLERVHFATCGAGYPVTVVGYKSGHMEQKKRSGVRGCVRRTFVVSPTGISWSWDKLDIELQCRQCRVLIYFLDPALAAALVHLTTSGGETVRQLMKHNGGDTAPV